MKMRIDYLSKKAITLIELIIGLVITTVIMSVTVASFNSMEGRKLDVQARNMVGNLIWAREIAAARHNNCTVVFNTGNNWYAFYNGTVSTDNLVKNQSLSRGVDLDSVEDWNGNTLSQIIFYSPKGNSDTSAVIILNQTNRLRRINISEETGFIRME
jgi:Tfp pilus assembly protein FimT